MDRRQIVDYIAALDDNEYSSLLRDARNTPPPARPQPGVDRLAQAFNDMRDAEQEGQK